MHVLDGQENSSRVRADMGSLCKDGGQPIGYSRMMEQSKPRIRPTYMETGCERR